MGRKRGQRNLGLLPMGEEAEPSVEYTVPVEDVHAEPVAEDENARLMAGKGEKRAMENKPAESKHNSKISAPAHDAGYKTVNDGVSVIRRSRVDMQMSLVEAGSALLAEADTQKIRERLSQIAAEFKQAEALHEMLSKSLNASVMQVGGIIAGSPTLLAVLKEAVNDQGNQEAFRTLLDIGSRLGGATWNGIVSEVGAKLPVKGTEKPGVKPKPVESGMTKADVRAEMNAMRASFIRDILHELEQQQKAAAVAPPAPVEPPMSPMAPPAPAPNEEDELNNALEEPPAESQADASLKDQDLDF